MEQTMRITAILSVVVWAIALTLMTPMPQASAMTTAAPAVIDQVAPNNALVENVRYVCRRYRVRRHGYWVWRTRCYWTRPYHRYYYGPYRHYRHRYWYR
jgi:hypothetical protein